MANEKLEKMLVETMKNILDQDDLGRVEGGVENEHSHHVQFQWEDILDSFALAVKDSNDFYDSLNSAFYKVHSYKFLEDSTFEEALVSELESQGIPHEDIEIAINALEKVRKEYIEGRKNENAVGWPEDMAGIKKVTQEPHDKPVSDNEKDTLSGDNEPFSGAEPDNVRPVENEA